MNEGHAQFCASAEWRAAIRNTILPSILATTDLGDDQLEVGPGYGATTDYLRRKTVRLTAVEIHPELAAGLADQFAGINVEVVEGDATALEFEDDRFTSATSFFMLHHVPSRDLQDRLFAEVARVLRPGGVFVAADSIASDELREFHEDDDYLPVDPTELTDRLTAAGFIDIDVQLYKDQGWNATARKPGDDAAPD